MSLGSFRPSGKGSLSLFGPSADRGKGILTQEVEKGTLNSCTMGVEGVGEGDGSLREEGPGSGPRSATTGASIDIG